MATSRRHLRSVPDLGDETPQADAERWRHPVRDDRVAYRLRVELEDVEPVVWREFEIAGDVGLDEVHDVLQIVMGWTDSHLHRFSLGDDWYGPMTTEFVTQFDLDEGDDGVLESTVRLGSAPGYAELRGTVAAAARGDMLDEWQRQRLQWLAGDTDPREVEVAFNAFDVDVVNTVLDRRSAWAKLPGELGALVERVPAVRHVPEHVALMESILAQGPVDVDVTTASAMTEPFTWMLRRMGDGLQLTSAGYLRPDDVLAVSEKLNLTEEWIGTFNREAQTPQVTDFRMLMRGLGLARQAKSRLLPTKLGRSMAENPVRLWWHIASRLPLGDGADRDVGLVGLLITAAGLSRGDPFADRACEELMADMGWRLSDGTPIRAEDILWRWSATIDALKRAGGFERSGYGEPKLPTPGGVLLARAAVM